MKRISVALLLAFAAAAAVSCGRSAGQDAPEAVMEETAEEVSPDEQAEVIYPDNKAINKYLLDLNRMYPDDAVSADQLTKSGHHGKEHDNQIIVSIRDYPATITGSSSARKGKLKVSVYMDNYDDDNTAIREMFSFYTHVFKPDITDEQVQELWDTEAIDGYDDIESQISMGYSADHVEYLTITGYIDEE